MYDVAILMSTYNGERYIKEQLDSLIKQENVRIKIFIRDDGSTDNTLKIIYNYTKQYDNIMCYAGKNIGYAKSFLELLRRAPKSEYYAFSDQDDVWEKNKLVKAISYLKTSSKPACYFSNLIKVDKNLKYIGKKEFPNLKTSLGSLLSRQRVAGCTMVLNADLAKIISCKNFLNSNMPCSHDNLVLLVCSIVKGDFFYDKNSYILYRRTGENTSVIGNGMIKRFNYEINLLKRIKRNEIADFIIKNYVSYIDKNDMKLLELVKNYKKNLKLTLTLFSNKNIKCGLKSVDLFNKIAILVRRY